MDIHPPCCREALQMAQEISPGFSLQGFYTTTQIGVAPFSRLLCDFYILWVKYSQVTAKSCWLVMEENLGTVVWSLWQLQSWVTP